MCGPYTYALPYTGPNTKDSGLVRSISEKMNLISRKLFIRKGCMGWVTKAHKKNARKYGGRDMSTEAGTDTEMEQARGKEGGGGKKG